MSDSLLQLTYPELAEVLDTEQGEPCASGYNTAYAYRILPDEDSADGWQNGSAHQVLISLRYLNVGTDPIEIVYSADGVNVTTGTLVTKTDTGKLKWKHLTAPLTILFGADLLTDPENRPYDFLIQCASENCIPSIKLVRVDNNAEIQWLAQLTNPQSSNGDSIQDATITATQIADATITAQQIANATITAAQIANATITGTQIANATITATNIANATITATQIANATITATQIANATITGTQIAAATIQGSNIASGTITATNIQAATITATEIQNATITGAKIASATITATNIVSGTITATQIANATITATQIANGTITSANIQNGTIVSADIASGTIVASNLATGTITANEIASATIVAGNIANLTITATQIANATITGAKIANATIAGGNIASATITGSNIAGGTITDSNIQAATITGASIAAATISNSLIVNSTITGAKIASATITATNIASATITATQIAASTITGSNIAAGTITASNIAAGTITATQLSATAIDSMTITGATIRTASSGARTEMNASNLFGLGFGGIGGINGSAVVQWYAKASDGKIYFGGGNGSIGGAGFEYVMPINASTVQAFRWTLSGADRAYLQAFHTNTSPDKMVMNLAVGYDTTIDSELNLTSSAGGGNAATASLLAYSSGSLAGIVATNEDTGTTKEVRVYGEMVFNPANDTSFLRSVKVGAIVSSTISGNQNNVATDVNSVFRYTASGANRNVTGFANGEPGKIIWVFNVGGSNNIVLANQNANSSASNRILCDTGADIALTPGQNRALMYDGTSSRWRTLM